MIDLCRKLSDIDCKQYRSLFDVFSGYYFLQITKSIIYPSIIYALYVYILMLNKINVVFGYRNITIPIYVIFVLAIFPCYQIFIPIFKERRILSRVLKNLSSDHNYIDVWKKHLLASSYITLVDLILSKKYVALSNNEYLEIKSQFVKQYSQEIISKNNKMFMYTELDKDYFIRYGQNNIDCANFISIVELRKTLEISDEEFTILKNNFINNNTFIYVYDLEGLKRLNIINEYEYYKKLYHVEVEKRLRQEWKRSLSITNFIIIFIVGIITLTVSK